MENDTQVIMKVPMEKILPIKLNDEYGTSAREYPLTSWRVLF